VQLIFAVQAHTNLACAAKMQKNVTVANLLSYLGLTSNWHAAVKLSAKWRHVVSGLLITLL